LVFHDDWIQTTAGFYEAAVNQSQHSICEPLEPMVMRYEQNRALGSNVTLEQSDDIERRGCIESRGG
jgi:hypothetical protein